MSDEPKTENPEATANVQTAVDTAVPSEVAVQKRKKSEKKPEVKSAPRVSPKPPAGKSKRHSNEQKLVLVKQIEERLAEKSVTLKQALSDVGISDQTYYVWKRSLSAAPVVSSESPSTSDDEFAEFNALEEENRRLRKLLAEKLRSENADLRKRLGMA